MKTHFGLKLTVTLILFAFILSIAIATTDHLRLRDQIEKNFHDQMAHIEDNVNYALRTVDKAYYLFGRQLAHSMDEASRFLTGLYERQPDFSRWDFTALREQLGFDIYIINEQNVVEYSSFTPDVGLDFNACCGKLVKVLEERRLSGLFHHDGIDIEQHTGYLKKYSYVPTHDQKYLIQLGYELQEDGIFVHYNFFDTMRELEEQYDIVNEIRVLNLGGQALGEPAKESKLTPERREAFETTLATREASEVSGLWNGETVTFRYVYYTSEFDQGTTQSKIVEINYNERELQAMLKQNLHSFLIRLLIVLVVTVLLSLGISRWLARPMYLAFHDSLTGLKNRAAFDDLLGTALREGKSGGALLLIDLDDFKLVNDNFGHDQGDDVLRAIGHVIRESAGKENFAFRIGGDEFALWMPSANGEEAERAAQSIIDRVLRDEDGNFQLHGATITVSIGIALASRRPMSMEALLKQADIALYASKNEGKNKYHLMRDGASGTSDVEV